MFTELLTDACALFDTISIVLADASVQLAPSAPSALLKLSVDVAANNRTLSAITINVAIIGFIILSMLRQAEGQVNDQPLGFSGADRIHVNPNDLSRGYVIFGGVDHSGGSG